MSNDHNTPAKLQLAECWLLEHFSGQPCIVFFEPIDEVDRLELIGDYLGLGARAILRIEECDIFVHPVDDDDLVDLIANADSETYGRVAGWDGEEIVTEND